MGVVVGMLLAAMPMASPKEVKTPPISLKAVATALLVLLAICCTALDTAACSVFQGKVYMLVVSFYRRPTIRRGMPKCMHSKDNRPAYLHKPRQSLVLQCGDGLDSILGCLNGLIDLGLLAISTRKVDCRLLAHDLQHCSRHLLLPAHVNLP